MRRKPSSFVLVVRLSLRMGAGPAPLASGPSSSSLSVDPQGAHQTTLTVFPGLAGDAVFGWYYPPTYFLVQASLALLPYGLAWAVWTVGTGALLALAARPALG